MRQTRLPPNVTRSTKLCGAQHILNLSLGAQTFVYQKT